MKLNYHNDAAHGWVAVKRALLKELGILDKITHCSYQRGNTVYLEEDQDLDTFMDAAKEAGLEIHFKEMRHVFRSHIRSYEPFSI